jgi:hypothetical protein
VPTAAAAFVLTQIKVQTCLGGKMQASPCVMRRIMLKRIAMIAAVVADTLAPGRRGSIC